MEATTIRNGMHGCKRKKQGKKGKSRADQAYSRSNEINDCLFVPEPRESPSLFVRVSKHRHYTPMKEERRRRRRFDQACRHFLTRGDRLPEKSPSNYEPPLRLLSYPCKCGVQMLELRVHGGVSSEITDLKDRTILQYRNLEPDISIQSSPILLFEFFPSRYEFIFILPYENKFYPSNRANVQSFFRYHLRNSSYAYSKTCLFPFAGRSLGFLGRFD